MKPGDVISVGDWVPTGEWAHCGIAMPASTGPVDLGFEMNGEDDGARWRWVVTCAA